MPEPQATEQPSLASTIGRIAGLIGSEGFPTGDRARLRRMTPGQPAPLAFIRFAVAHLPGGWEHQLDDWITLVAGIAIMAPGAHRPGFGLGRALAEAGYSEFRLERLLDADGQTRRILLLRAARFLAAKQTPCDWADGARLLLTRDEAKIEKVRLGIARNYFSNLTTGTTAA
ncbi:MAG: hypothetical protein Kow0020_14990 [Wenzhouxiangellaceae bacterium]